MPFRWRGAAFPFRYAGQRHQAGIWGNDAAHIDDLLLTTDESVRGGRKIIRLRIERPQRSKTARETRDLQVEQNLRVAQIFQTM